MDSKYFDAVVVDFRERGLWTAIELASRGLKVAFCRLKPDLLGLKEVDCEASPFPVFGWERLTDTQKLSLTSQFEITNSSYGMDLLTNWGHISFGSSLSQYQCDSLGLSKEVVALMNDQDPATDPVQYSKDFFSVLNSIKRQSFEKRWPVKLFSEFFSNQLESDDEHSVVNFSKMRGPIHFLGQRKLGPDNLKALLDKYAIGCFDNCEVLDIGLKSKTVEAVEVNSQLNFSGLLSLSNLVWCLTTEETMKLPELVNRKLLPSGALYPDWHWTSLNIRISEAASKVIPASLLLVEDVRLTYASENLILLQKEPNEPEDSSQTQVSGEVFFKAWIKQPVQSRFQTGMRQETASKVVESLCRQLKLLKSEVTWCADRNEMEKVMVEANSAPVAWPIFSFEKFQDFNSRKFNNLFWQSAESAATFSHEALFWQQKLHVEKVHSSWIKDKKNRSHKVISNDIMPTEKL